MVSMTLAESLNPVAIELAPAITTLIVFGIVCLILFTKVWPKIASGLDERQAKLRQEIEAAEAAQAEAMSAMKSQQAELGKARAEAHEMIAKGQIRCGSLLPGPCVSRPRHNWPNCESRPGHEIRLQPRRRPSVNLHAESAVLATAIASRILKREINANDQQSLIDDSLRELQSDPDVEAPTHDYEANRHPGQKSTLEASSSWRKPVVAT